MPIYHTVGRPQTATFACVSSSNLFTSMPGILGSKRQGNGSGYLTVNIIHGHRPPSHSSTYVVIPDAHLNSYGTSFPWSSFGNDTFHSASTVATAYHTDISAKCLPTQLRRPNPNAMFWTLSDVSAPSGSRNRSGMNSKGFGYFDSSCAMDLGNERHD